MVNIQIWVGNILLSCSIGGISVIEYYYGDNMKYLKVKLQVI